MPDFAFLHGRSPVPPRHVSHISREVTNQLDDHNTAVIGDFHRVQEAMQQNQDERSNNGRARQTAPRYRHPDADRLQEFHEVGEARSRRQRPEEPARRNMNVSREPSSVVYEGDERTCPICIEEYLDQEQLVRFPCRHTTHADCWTQQLLVEEDPPCPCCRGSGRVVATFTYIAPRQETPRTPLPTDRRSEEAFGTPEGHFPWWPSDATAFHSETSAPGRQSIVVDPGAYTNLAGENWAVQQATIAREHGYQSTRTPMRNPLSIKGVGNGTQSCTHVCSMPIAVPNTLHPEAPREAGDITRGESCRFT